MNKRKYRIFLGVQEIAGMFARLNNAFSELGIKSDFYCLCEYEFSKTDNPIMNKRMVKNFFYHTKKRHESITVKEKKHWDKLQLIDIVIIFIYSLIHYNAYIYIFGHGLFFYNWYLRKIPEVEFQILKLFRKKVIMWMCGSDSRAPYCDVDIYHGDYEKMHEETKKRLNKVRMLEKYTTMIDYTASAHFHSKPYIIYNGITVPVDMNEYVNKQYEENITPIILHAPSNQKAKGTDKIREIIKEIEEEGYLFEYVEVSGMSHNKVLEQIKKADIVIDQLYCDTPMAGFAAEAALNGVPVIVGGYYAKWYKCVLPNPIPPNIFCEPEEVKQIIIELLKDPVKRKQIGKVEEEFIKENSLATTVCKKIINIFDNQYPEEWTFNPSDSDYVWGLGLTKAEVRKNVRCLVEKYGMDSLGLDEDSVLWREYQNMLNEE